MKIEDCNVNIHDNFGLYDLPEIVAELKKLHSGFSTLAMSDYALFLKGQKKMLEDIISYLERIGG